MKIGDEVAVKMNDGIKIGTCVSNQGEDLVIAIEESGKKIHHRMHAMDVSRLTRCDQEELNYFYEENLSKLLDHCQEATAALLPNVKIEEISDEHSLICKEWGVKIVPETMFVCAIGRVFEKPGWCVVYETINRSQYRDDWDYDVVEVGKFVNLESAVEAFVKCIFDRKMENHFEKNAFF